MPNANARVVWRGISLLRTTGWSRAQARPDVQMRVPRSCPFEDCRCDIPVPRQSARYAPQLGKPLRIGSIKFAHVVTPLLWSPSEPCAMLLGSARVPIVGWVSPALEISCVVAAASLSIRSSALAGVPVRTRVWWPAMIGGARKFRMRKRSQTVGINEGFDHSIPWIRSVFEAAILSAANPLSSLGLQGFVFRTKSADPWIRGTHELTPS